MVARHIAVLRPGLQRGCYGSSMLPGVQAASGGASNSVPGQLAGCGPVAGFRGSGSAWPSPAASGPPARPGDMEFVIRLSGPVARGSCPGGDLPCPVLRMAHAAPDDAPGCGCVLHKGHGSGDQIPSPVSRSRSRMPKSAASRAGAAATQASSVRTRSDAAAMRCGRGRSPGPPHRRSGGRHPRGWRDAAPRRRHRRSLQARSRESRS